MLLSLNKKYIPLFESESRYFVITGGRGSGKSFGLNVALLMLTFERGHVILFTRYTLVSAQISIIPEFIEKIELMGLTHKFHITKDEIVNLDTGSSILFKGIKTSSGNQTANLKSLAGVTTWVLDEAEELQSEETFDKIDYSIRKKGIQNRVILVLNPTTKEHFIYKKFFESNGVNAGENTIKNGTTYIHTTYLDNLENLSESYVSNIEKMKLTKPEKFNHVILGGWLDKAEGVIFNNWSIGEFVNCGSIVFGQDFGSVDPTTLVKTSIDKKNKKIYIELCYYISDLTPTKIVELDKKFCGDALIVADHAESLTVAEMKANRLNVVDCIKGAGSVNDGIRQLKDYDLIIHPDSTELIKELNNYRWLESKSETPLDAFNHAIDALRYAVSYQLKTPNYGQYHIY
jgi:phage terminase large subunit